MLKVEGYSLLHACHIDMSVYPGRASENGQIEGSYKPIIKVGWHKSNTEDILRLTGCTICFNPHNSSRSYVLF